MNLVTSYTQCVVEHNIIQNQLIDASTRELARKYIINEFNDPLTPVIMKLLNRSTGNHQYISKDRQIQSQSIGPKMQLPD